MSTITIGGNELPANGVAAAIVGVALLYLGYDAYLAEDSLMSRYDAIVAQEQAIEEKRSTALQLKQQTREIDKVKSEIIEVEKSIAVLRSKIPVEAQLPVLLYDIERMARTSRGDLESFQPEALTTFKGDPSGEIQELPITIKASGTFPEVLRFLEALNLYERKLSVSNLSLKPTQSGPSTVSGGTDYRNNLAMEFKLNAYILRSKGGTP
ncbi:MAG: type 4a pilus biogenesis protein PilO [Candidatus Sericytochromatia bacterium]|nr:type 4a pilus biogenesis protein PilO [Candidatus Sericytochromatia bacterium]